MSAATEQSDTKTCKRCKQKKPLTEFHKAARMKDGRRIICRTCVAEAAKIEYDKDPTKRLEAARQWKQGNLEHVRQYARDYGKTMWRDRPEEAREKERLRAIAHPGRTTENGRGWRKKNPDAARAHRRRWKQGNPEQVLAGERRRYQLNPAKAANKAHTRRILMADGGSFDASDIADIRRMQNDQCAICAIPLHGKGQIGPH